MVLDYAARPLPAFADEVTSIVQCSSEPGFKVGVLAGHVHVPGLIPVPQTVIGSSHGIPVDGCPVMSKVAHGVTLDMCCGFGIVTLLAFGLITVSAMIPPVIPTVPRIKDFDFMMLPTRLWLVKRVGNDPRHDARITGCGESWHDNTQCTRCRDSYPWH